MVEAAINPGADVPNFVSTYKANFPVGTADASAALKYLEWPFDKRPLVPLMVFIDRKGFIRAQYSGADEDFFNEQTQDQHLRAEAEKYLNEKPAPAPAKKGGKKG